jgi:hypothetical protein
MERVCIVCSKVGLTAEEAVGVLERMGYKSCIALSEIKSNPEVLYGKYYGDVTYSAYDWYSENYKGSYRELTKEEIFPEEKLSKVKSDGGSSSYYLFPQALVDHIIATGKFEVEDLIKYGFGNDYDFGNIVKATKRLYELKVGGGKEGSTAEYEANKIRYYVDRVLEDM